MRIRFVNALPLCLCCILGCNTTNSTVPQKESISFSIVHVNWAWGFIASGWFADSQGQVFTFETRNPSDSLHTALYGDTLSKVSAGADIGATVYTGYMPNTGGGYTSVFLREMGDWTIILNSQTADSIYTWLNASRL
jgi:hypothetical protein